MGTRDDELIARLNKLYNGMVNSGYRHYQLLFELDSIIRDMVLRRNMDFVIPGWDLR